MSLSVQLGPGSLVQLGVGLSDIAVLIRNGANWLKTRQNDHDLFESISEVYGEVLRRRGLLNVAQMEDVWGTRYNFIYHGKSIHRQFPSSVCTEALEGFSWIMVSIIVSLDLCLTTTLIQDVLVDVFLAVLDRDDKAELSESLKISLNTNIQSWRSTGCVRGMVVPITTAIRRCRKEATGENMIPQLNQCEKQEVVELLVWLFSSDLKRFQAISATCYSLVAGWKAAGICVDLGTLETSIEFKPTVYYTHGVGEDNTSTEILEAAEDLFPSQRVIAPQRCLFRFGYPEDMIECLRIPMPVRSDISVWWQIGKEAAEGCNISFETTETDIIYRISHHTTYSRRWPPSTVRLSKTWFIAPDDRICQAIEDLTGRNSEPFAHWISMYMAEGNTDTSEALLEDIHISIPNEELDGMLRFQGLVYGFWYQLLGQLLLSDHLQEDIMLSGIWGRRSASLLVRFFELARENGEGGIERTYLMRTLRRMFLGEKAPFLGDENLHNDANLVGIIGSISLLCYSLLRLPETPQDCARFYLVSLPIVELFGNQHGELLSSMRSGGVDTYNAETRTLDSTLLRIHPKRAWSVHPKLKFINGRVENVSMVARCGGIPVLQFPSHMADHLFLGMELHSYLGCSNSSQVSDGQSKSVRVSRVLCGNEITEEDFLKGSIPQPCVMLHDSGMENKWMTLVHSSGSLAMRYAAIGLLSQSLVGHKEPRAKRNAWFESNGKSDTSGFGESYVLCKACDIHSLIDSFPPYATVIL